MSHLRRGLIFSLAVVCCWAGAQPRDEVRTERARIADERGRVEARFAAEEKACYGKFGVNDCLQEARTRRREVLADLRRKEVSLNDADRRRRAAERLGEIEQRSSAAKDARAIAQRNKAIADQREREQRAAGKAAKREREGVQEPAGPAGIARTKDRRAKPLRNQPAEPKSLDTESNAQAYGQRLNEAQQRKAKAGKKLTERTKPAARSLPLPP